MKKNVGSQIVGAQINARSDGSPLTTGSVTVYVTGDNGTQAAGSVGSGACTHKGNGWWSYAPAQAETNYDHVVFTFVHSSGVNVGVQIYPSFPQSGDNFTRLGAPNGASLAADIAAVKGDTVDIEGKVDTVDGIVDAILVDTDSTIPGLLATIAGYIDTEIATLLARMGTPSDLGSGATLAANLVDIEAQTDDIGTAGAGLTAVPWNPSWDAEVQSEATDALNAYDPPTAAELAAAVAPLATSAALAIVDAIVDSIKGTTDKVDETLESGTGGVHRFTDDALQNAPAGGGGSAPTVPDIVAGVWSALLADYLTSAGDTVADALNNANAAGNPWAAIIEGSLTAQDILRVLAGVAAGKTVIVQGSGHTATVTFRDITDASDIVEAQMDGSERVSVAVTP